MKSSSTLVEVGNNPILNIFRSDLFGPRMLAILGYHVVWEILWGILSYRYFDIELNLSWQ